MSNFKWNIKTMHTETGWLHTLKLKLHNTLTQYISFSWIFFTLQNNEWDKYVQNFIIQQNKLASATDDTTNPIYTGGFIYMLNKLQHKSLGIQGTSINTEKKITHKIRVAQILGTWSIILCTVASNIFSTIISVSSLHIKLYVS